MSTQDTSTNVPNGVHRVCGRGGRSTESAEYRDRRKSDGIIELTRTDTQRRQTVKAAAAANPATPMGDLVTARIKQIQAEQRSAASADSS